jgi:hypothetical protein
MNNAPDEGCRERLLDPEDSDFIIAGAGLAAGIFGLARRTTFLTGWLIGGISAGISAIGESAIGLRGIYL